MGKKIGVIFVWCLLSTYLYAQESKKDKVEKVPFFHGTWEELLAEAKKQNKPFFVDFYTVWCGPCKLLDRRVFTDPDVIAYAKEHYLAYKVDAEKGQGPTLARKYHVRAYPTIIFFAPDGTELGREVGYSGVSGFLGAMTKFKRRYEKNYKMKK